VQIDFLAGRSSHSLHLRQTGNQLEGTHQGDFVSRDLSGIVDGDIVKMTSTYAERHGDALTFGFTGKISENGITGALDMGEYLAAQWTARRHEYRRE
jgi:L-seryl-tRNA(Ser) seleniumtransferase